MGKICAICGNPSGMYPLCKDCFILKDEGKVVKCIKCGIWHIITEPCKCNENFDNKKESITQKEETNTNTQGNIEKYKFEIENLNKELEKQNNNSENLIKTLTIENKTILEETTKLKTEIEKLKTEKTINKCITCGKDAGNLFFCPECLNKYKNKELFIKITSCNNFELMDSNFEGRYACTDGHIVKSKSEVLIDNYLFYHNIAHAYEKPFSIDSEKEHDLHPDFYLPERDIYIEHWGYDSTNKQYTETKEYKNKFYEASGKTFIYTDEKEDMDNINAALDRKLKYVKENVVNYKK